MGPHAGQRLDTARLCEDLVRAVEQSPDAKAKWSPDHSTLRFRAFWRGDKRASAYVKPAGGADGSLVFGDSGTGDKGGWQTLSDHLGFDVEAYRESAPGPRGDGRASGAARTPRTRPAPENLQTSGAHPDLPAGPASAGSSPPKTYSTAELDAWSLVSEWYLYPHADGRPCLRIGRTADKSFLQYRADPSAPDRWLTGCPEVRPLYRLPELTAADPTIPVYVVEGEKDADTLAARGLLATTASGGAGKARYTDWTPLHGRSVLVLYDHDEPGLAHAQDVAARLDSLGAESIRVVSLPGLPTGSALPANHGRDVADWLGGGHTVVELQAACDATPEHEPPLPGRLVRARDWRDSAPLDYVISPLVPADSLVMLYGPPGSGKSLIALDWAARAADTGPVVYVLAEGQRGFRLRLSAWERQHKHELSPDLLLWRGPVNLLNASEVGSFLEAVLPLGPRLVVFDTYSRCIAGVDENDQAPATLAVETFGRLQDAGAAVVILHHPDKAGKGPRGSTVLIGAADTILRVNATGTRHTVTCEKSKDGGEIEPVGYSRTALDFGDGITAPVVDRSSGAFVAAQRAPLRLTENRRATLSAVSELLCAGDTATFSAIRDRTGLRKSSQSNALCGLVGASMLEGGGGEPYTAGQLWPAEYPLPTQSGPVRSSSVQGGLVREVQLGPMAPTGAMDIGPGPEATTTTSAADTAGVGRELDFGGER